MPPTTKENIAAVLTSRLNLHGNCTFSLQYLSRAFWYGSGPPDIERVAESCYLQLKEAAGIDGYSINKDEKLITYTRKRKAA